MAADAERNGVRPILVNGERLRKRLDRVPGGGGEKFHPFTFDETREYLLPQARQLESSVDEFDDELRGSHIVFQATLLPNYLAASYFPTALIEVLDLVPLGSRTARGTLRTAQTEREDVVTKSLILAGTDGAIGELRSLLEGGGDSRTERRAAESLRQFSDLRLPSSDEVLRGTPTDADRGTELALFESVLHPRLDRAGASRLPAADDVFRKWERYVRSLGGRVLRRYRRNLAGLTFVPVRLPIDAALDAARFNPLRAIRPMPAMRPLPNLLRAGSARVAPPPDARPLSGLSVAVFDGGVDDASPIFQPAVVNDDLTTEPIHAPFVRHGSGVVGAVLYGRVESAGDELGRPSTHVEHFRVVPHPNAASDPDAYWVLDQIVEQVEVNDFDVVNLSLGPDIAVDEDDEPNRWTATLDSLAYEHGVLFVTAVGNNGEEDDATGLNRVQVPADSVNGLSVGACDLSSPTLGWQRTPYSPIGPGRPGGRVQPCGVQFGGLVTADPFLALQGDGSLLRTDGTSFASPLVVNGLVVLSAELGRARSTQNNLRAFAIHYAEEHPDGALVSNDVGFGRLPVVYDLGCDTNEVTVLYEDQIDRDEVVGLPLPVPESVTSGMVELRWTLVITAPTDPTESTEYTKATVEPVFRPHIDKHRFTRDGGEPVVVNVRTERKRVGELLADGFTPSAEPVTKSVSLFGPDEVDRRDAGKWETVRRGSVRMQARSLRSPRLDLSYIARDGGVLDTSESTIDYSLLVTVRTRPDITLYDDVRTTYQVLNPLTAARARTSVRVRT